MLSVLATKRTTRERERDGETRAASSFDPLPLPRPSSPEDLNYFNSSEIAVLTRARGGGNADRPGISSRLKVDAKQPLLPLLAFRLRATLYDRPSD